MTGSQECDTCGPQGQRGRVWVISELYYPEETSTGHLLTKIAEGIAEKYPVNVLCAQPTYSARGVRAPAHEMRNGVHIQRCWGTTLNKDIFLRRLINLVTISLSMVAKAFFQVRRHDRVLVVTNPQMMPYLMAAVCRLRGAHCLLLIHDVYPDALVVMGMVRPQSLFVRLLDRLNRLLYRSVARVIVLGHDMGRLVLSRLDGRPERVVLIPNWADHDDITPVPRAQNRLLAELGLLDKFVVQYAGNMGRTHGLETLVAAALRLRTDPKIHFLFIGSGGKKAWLENAVREQALHNVTILPNRPRTDQINFLNACDVAIISFMPKMAGISVPSRMYNILAAGKPIIAVADDDSELAHVVRQDDVGWIVPPNETERVVEAIRSAAADPQRLDAMGRRARDAAADKYSFRKVLGLYHALLANTESPRRERCA